MNGSGSHHQLRKLQKRLDLILGPTAKSGGVYIYANLRFASFFLPFTSLFSEEKEKKDNDTQMTTPSLQWMRWGKVIL